MFGLDLGTSNSGLARWDSARERAELIELTAVCRKPGSADPLEAPRLVPSATHVIEPEGLVHKGALGRFVRRRWLLGQEALIGRQALERNEAGFDRAFAPRFKMQLMQAPDRALVRLGGKSHDAREVARRFLRELLRQVKREHGLAIRDLVIATPVDAYERFRAEVQRIAHGAGVKRVRFIDEPVAAAMGYGLALDRDRRVLVVDIGGGTMHGASCEVTIKGARAGSCRVLKKAGRPLGGDVVDRWLLEAFCERLGFELSPTSDEWDRVLWHRFMLDEARRVKEALFFEPEETFTLVPPEDFRRIEARLRGKAEPLKVSRGEIVEILRKNGFYDALWRCLEEVTGGEEAPDEVIVLGGSTLLPEVYAGIEQRFGRDRVRAWSPFEAVALGASVFAAGAYDQHDYVLHDYAIVTHDAQTKEKQYTIVVPRGTRFPTTSPVWNRRLVPTCALGEPESVFKLVVCEIGRAELGELRLHFDEAGQLIKLGKDSAQRQRDQVVVPLNEQNPTLGVIDPPHAPGDRRPRLDVSFTVNADRWLCVDVGDLKTGKALLAREPVVRLL